MHFAIGLMSGTSRDGIDAAIIRTDGLQKVEPVEFLFAPYAASLKSLIAEACEIAMRQDQPLAHAKIDECQAILTEEHAAAALRLISAAGLRPNDISIVGLHGHTIAHRADLGWTWQIGDPQILADGLSVNVIAEMRRFDVTFGGQGAPLIPVYHRAIFADPDAPVAILNLGGVANLTYLAPGSELIAFDCGMASALIDDWMAQHSNCEYDEDGACAARGAVDSARLAQMLGHPYFAAPPPKSLDRGDFDLRHVAGLALADGAATLTAFSAKAVARGLEYLPSKPKRLIVCGGGRKNKTMLAMIEHFCAVETVLAEQTGWDGDAIEAQGFAYLAYRCLHGLPITYPGTTGVAEPMSGGIMFKPAAAKPKLAAA